MTRYKLINRIVNDIYIKLNITAFPIDELIIVNFFNNIRLISYSEYAKDHKLTTKDMLQYFPSDDGFSVYSRSKDRHIIYYNDFIDGSHKRMRWTVMHELGHIACKHHLLNKNDYDDNELYEFTEHEANYFTSMLLAHPAILKEINVHTAKEIEFFCDMSNSAANYRFSNYKSFFYVFNSSDRLIVRNFKNYIESKNNDYNEHLAFLKAFQF